MGRRKDIGHVKRNGFTLIEVIITTAIISIITVISIVSMAGLKVKREVEGSSRIVAAAIREAQNYAVTGKNVVGSVCGSGTEACVPCEFRFGTGTNSYTISQSNIPTSGSTCTSFVAGPTIGLPNGVEVTAQSVRFSVPRSEPRDSSGNELNSGSIDFKVSKGGVDVYICVYPLGRVEERPIGSTGC